ncbi:hypothetical protein B0H17DRAFT_1032204 [Mycena rosella]|uniref:SnoaL-like domain-containing protein n=1 Tax=Mycena rosella TaxID=1033263 RepID=A0AAD7MAQ0_MYCRO|nr:hypothetical protein B0H17DRAFT_1032204 [Mycena rosella]
MSIPNAKQLENAHAFLTHLNALNWVPLAELLSPEFKHQYLPASIIPPDGKEMRGKKDFIEILKSNLVGLFDKVTYGPPLDVIHGTDKVVFHLKSDGKSKSGKDYNNEFMITFHFDGEQIIKLNEFVDSKYSSAFFRALWEEAKST